MEEIRIRDPGSGMVKSRIRDNHPASATLIIQTVFPATVGQKAKKYLLLFGCF
jgi:hypothetical protein